MALTTEQIRTLRNQLATNLGGIAGGSFDGTSLAALFGRAAYASGEGAGTPVGSLSATSYGSMIRWLAGRWGLTVAETEQFIGQLASDSNEMSGTPSGSLTNQQKLSAMAWYANRLRYVDQDGTVSEADTEAFFGRAAFNSNLLVSSPASISGLAHWYRADQEITPNGADVAGWGDLVGTVDFAQATAADQGVLNASDASLGLQASIGFDSANTEYMKAGAAADWQFLSDGSGMTIFMVLHSPSGTGNKYLLDTANASGSNVGMFVRQDGTNGTLTFAVAAGGGVNAIVATTANGSFANATPHMVCIGYAEGASPTEYEIRIDGAATLSGNSSNPPTVSVPFGELTLARIHSSSSYFTGSIAELAIYNRRLSTAEMQQLEAYAEARYAL